MPSSLPDSNSRSKPPLRSVSLKGAKHTISTPRFRNSVDGTERTRKRFMSSSMVDLYVATPNEHISEVTPEEPSGKQGELTNRDNRAGIFRRKRSLKVGTSSEESESRDSLFSRITSLLRGNSIRKSPSPEPSSSRARLDRTSISSDATRHDIRDSWDFKDGYYDSQKGSSDFHTSTELEVVPEEPIPTLRLPSPCQGLFESSGSNFSVRSQRSQSLSLKFIFDPASTIPTPSDGLSPTSEYSGFLHPLQLSPLSSTTFERTEQTLRCDGETLVPFPPSPILSRSPSPNTQAVFRTLLEAELNGSFQGHSMSFDPPRLSHSRSASESDGSSSGVATPSVHTLPSPVSLEYVLSTVGGCKLKDSIPPKTWAVEGEDESGVPRTMKDDESFGNGRGVGRLVIPVEEHVTPSTAVIVGLDRQTDDDEACGDASACEETVESHLDGNPNVPVAEKNPVAESDPAGAKTPSVEELSESEKDRGRTTVLDWFRRAFVGGH